ncbi:sigma-54 dependent transcriptional regulator [Nitrococcus mobilis]|uniref:Sigma-54 specific, transcriptional regulator, Fis family protein n=1 Tax=Nitrococcus mobilis Nb-231 TaxID=314278 RepID=A4BUD3_9GAMM|nr:sigma-54-dependent Fis family transcriptional regulator [Nitrococcus mobilis]EAR20647.1 Sigma-54 specific, transcriptional regulator, Fis family protein [Nitrococcus mobilis Nb-231]
MVKVLVLDRDADRARGIEAVIHFLEHEPVVVSRAEMLATIGQQTGYALGLITDDPSEARTSAWLAALGQTLPNLPVFLLRPCGVRAPNGGALAGNVLGTLGYPLRQQELSAALRQALSHNAQQGDSAQRAALAALPRLVGESTAMQRVRQLIGQVAGSDATVLILGESGTGKEIVARQIHAQSNRRDQPFVPINCGAIPTELLESELFGHEKGAFTGAVSSRRGRFELAQGGSLFLDEIGDMSLHMQVKLLRVLQERTYERVGGNKTHQADVRVIAATHRDLEVQIAQDAFREDLFYRLNVFPIEVPALRQRIADLPVLAEELIRRIEAEGRGVVRLTAQALSVLSQYGWPGNVRELANLIERLAILRPYGEAGVADLPEKILEHARHAAAEQQAAGAQSAADHSALGSADALSRIVVPDDGIDLKEWLTDMEIRFIRQALDLTDGVVARAAKLLRLRRTTLVEKLRKYGIQREGMDVS